MDDQIWLHDVHHDDYNVQLSLIRWWILVGEIKSLQSKSIMLGTTQGSVQSSSTRACCHTLSGSPDMSSIPIPTESGVAGLSFSAAYWVLCWLSSEMPQVIHMEASSSSGWSSCSQQQSTLWRSSARSALRFGDPDFIVHCFSQKGELVMRPYLDAALHSAGLETHTNVTNTSQAAVI